MSNININKNKIIKSLSLLSMNELKSVKSEVDKTIQMLEKMEERKKLKNISSEPQPSQGGSIKKRRSVKRKYVKK